VGRKEQEKVGRKEKGLKEKRRWGERMRWKVDTLQ